jgi:hypothetical protein
MSRGQSPAAFQEPQLPSGWCRTSGCGRGSYRIVDENGTVVAGDWANADGGSGLDFADHDEHEPKGVPGARRLFAVKG